MDKTLNLAEELLLLALNEEKGTVLMTAATGLPYGLAGAILIELEEAGLVRLEGKALVAAASGSSRDEILDEVLTAIRSSAKTRNLGHWVGRFGRSAGKIKRRLLDRLVAKGILRREEHRLLWIFPTTRFPEVDPMPEYRIRERVRAAIRGITVPDKRTAALVSLVHACDLTGTLFDKGERREARKKAKAISRSQPIGSAVARAVEAVRAAVIAASS